MPDSPANPVELLEQLLEAVRATPGALDRRLAGVAAQAQQVVQAAGTARAAAGEATRAAEAIQGAGRRQALWQGLGIGLGVLVACGAAWWLGNQGGSQQGRAEGYAAGVQVNQDQAAAASWANTPAGQLAWKLETTNPGTLAKLAGCDQPGWTVEAKGKGRICIPRPASDGSFYGWYVP